MNRVMLKDGRVWIGNDPSKGAAYGLEIDSIIECRMERDHMPVYNRNMLVEQIPMAMTKVTLTFYANIEIEQSEHAMLGRASSAAREPEETFLTQLEKL